MLVHAAGLAGLILIFVVGTLRPVNLGALGLVMTYLVGTIIVGEAPAQMFSGFPVDLLVLLVGVTYLFSVAAANGTVEWLVDVAAGLVKGRRALVPWAVFVVASLPAMAGALGLAGVAMLAPVAMRLAERYDLDRRVVGLMVVHGAAAGNFSPLNVLSAIVVQGAARSGFAVSALTLFAANAAYNVALGAIIVSVIGRKSARGSAPAWASGDDSRNAQAPTRPRGALSSLTIDQGATLAALVLVAIAALRFGLNVGFLALGAGVLLHLAFPKRSAGAEQGIAWSVVLLVCGVVTYVAALQRYGTVDAAGTFIAGLGSASLAALLLCAVAAITSAFASSAGILGAMIPLAAPLMAGGAIDPTWLAIAVALSATIVDATPFSTVGALVVANARRDEQAVVYRGLLRWGGAMVLTVPLVTWVLFIR